MPRRVHLRVDLENLSVGTDDVADALRGAGVLAVARPVREPDLACRIAEQWEVVLKLLGERAVLLLRVEADSKDLRVLLLELPGVVAEPATLGRSAGSVGLGVEPEDDDLSQVILEADEVPPVVLHFELGSFCTFLEHQPISGRRAARPATARSTCSIVL